MLKRSPFFSAGALAFAIVEVIDDDSGCGSAAAGVRRPLLPSVSPLQNLTGLLLAIYWKDKVATPVYCSISRM